MKPTVIYIHGYGSTGATDTAKNLRSILANEVELISPTYDGSEPLAAAQQLEALVRETAGGTLLIVGTSLGGFFANYLARVCNVPAILVNPSLRPSASLHKYGESPSALAGYTQLESAEALQTTFPKRLVVVGTRDTVVDPRTNGLTLREATVLLDMGHRIEPAFYETIAGLILQMTKAD